MQGKSEEAYSSTVINPSARTAPYEVTYSNFKSGVQFGNLSYPNYPQPSGYNSTYLQYPPNPPIFQPQNPEITKIRDYLAWSISSIFVGWLFLGIIPLIFSLLCRRYKRNNNAHRARTMSVLALVFNILVDLAGTAAWIGLIVALVTAKKATSSYTGCGLYSYYC